MIEKLFIVAIALTWRLTSAEAQNLLVNGGFETVTPATSTLRAGNTNLSGWSISGVGSLYPVSGRIGPDFSFYAKEGESYVSFNYDTVTLSQVFPTIPNESYDVSFCVGYFQGRTNMGVIASISSEPGSSLAVLAVAAPSTRGWNNVSRLRFTATSSLTKLQFIGTNATPNVDLLLDDVSVESVTRPVSIGSPGFQICWESNSERLYQLQYRSNLTSSLWINLGVPTAGTGLPICSVQPTAESQSFYRVITLP